MSNNVVRQFLKNYYLIHEKGFEDFSIEQAKLFAPELVTIVSDSRGSFIYIGKIGFFKGMKSWSKHFFVVDGGTVHDYVQEEHDHVFVRMHGDIKLLGPVAGKSVSKADEHDWTEAFDLSGGLITRIEIKLIFHP